VQDLTGIYWVGKTGQYNPLQWWPTLEITRSVLVNCEIAQAGGTGGISLQRTVLQGESCIDCDIPMRATLTRCRFEACSGTQMGLGCIVYGNRNAAVEVNTCTFATCTASTAVIIMQNGARGTVVSNGGTSAGAGVPLILRNGSSVVASGNSIVGAAAGSDCTIGAHAVAAWGTVQTANGVSDIADPNAQLCRVSSG
jgi:hypothetical protein